MPEEKRHTDIDELIARHLAGTATAQEEAALQAWLEAGPLHRDELEQMRRLWQEAEKIRALARPDLDSEWRALRRRMHGRPQSSPVLKTVHRKRMTTRLLRIAAVLVVGLFAAALVPLITGPLSHKVYTAAAQTEVITLPDGSTVDLDRGSRLITPRRFGKESRQVLLEGTAFFAVVHDAVHPFTVQAGGVDITVLGTKFNVHTDPTDKTVIDLVEGSVQVAAPGDGKVVLAPGEEARWDREKKELTRTTITDPNFLAWKTRILTFRNTPLQQVLATLEKTYHTSFRTTGSPALSCHVTASFEKEPLEHVLETLSTILGVSFEKTESGYTVTGDGCRE